MDFVAVVDQVIALLRQRGRVTYRLLKRQFQLDDEALEDLKIELIDGQRLATDEQGTVLVWTGETAALPAAAAAPAPASAPLGYTPPYLAEKILTSRSALEGERKQVTVLFVDVSGYTALAETLDPEEVHQLMERAFARMLEVVHHYEGTVNQFLGDGIMALFGAPIAHEDHAVRAVHAALGIQQTLAVYREQLHAERAIDFQVRMGLNTGPVVVGTIGDNLRMDYTAVGDTTNLAARLLARAEPGHIWVGETTANAVARHFRLQALGAIAVKGKVALVRPYRVEGSRGVHSRLDAVAERGLTPLVGRVGELAVLQERLAEMHAGRGQVLVVSGEAGIGKSRLLLEFRRQAEATGVRWLVGRCVSYGRHIACLPLIDVIRDLTGLQETDDVATILTKIDTRVRRVGDHVAWTVPFVRLLLSLDPGDAEVAAMVPIQQRGRLTEALGTLLVAVSHHQPVVVCIEDLHWIDAHSEDILHLVLESIAAVPVLVLLTHRPGYAPPFGEQTYYSRITLHGLPDAQMRVMIAGVLQQPGLPAPVRDLIAQRAEGNPLFTEELCKTLVEDGTLRWADGSYQLTRSLQELTIPSTIQDVIMARVDRLPGPAKTALQVAAVIGREFTARLVERVSTTAHEAVQALGELRAVELIYEKTRFPELVYLFKHALTHDVAYASLLRQRRTALHQRVGAVIEALYADRLPEFYETLAWHYAQGEIWPRALDYLLKAADQARARYAYAEAIHHCTEALHILARHEGAMEARRRTHEGLGDLQSLLGHIAEANDAYDHALEVAETPATRQRLGNKYHRLGTVVRQGARIAYYEHGSGEPPLLLMFPSLYSKTMWQPIVEVLCQEFRVIVVEPRGVGRSDPIAETHFLRDHVEDACAVVEATGHGPVVFVGMSAAAALAVHFATAYPHLVERLVLVGARATLRVEEAVHSAIAPEEIRQRSQRRQERRAWLQAGDYAQVLRSFLPMIYSEPGSRHLIEVLTHNALEAQPQIIVDFFTVDDPGRELRPLLPTLRAPTLVVHGEQDRAVPVEAGRYLADHIAGAQFYLFKGRGHVPMFTATTEFAQVVRNFIRTGRPT